jgi:small basic protein
MKDQSPDNKLPTCDPAWMGIILLLSAVEAVAAIWYILQIPADTRNAVWLGLSAQRLGLVVILLFGMIVCLGAGGLCLLKKRKCAAFFTTLLSRKWLTAAAFPLLVAAVLAVLAFVFSPSYQFGRLQAYFERLQPGLVWLALVVFQILIYINLHTRKSVEIPTAEKRKSLTPVVVIFGGFIFVWGLMGITGLGIEPDNVHWNNAGAPLLMWQILAALFLGAVFAAIEARLKEKTASKVLKSAHWADIAIAVLIWAIAASLWISEPMPRSFFAPGPYPPNYEPYPFSDAAGYDVSAQYALVGQGLMNKGYVDKPLYSGLLVLLHVLGGQSYLPVINGQTVLIALLPALLYLIGKKIHSRGAGVAAAFLVIFRELNTIGATLWILSSNTRVMMSESLTMLGVGFFVFFLVLWGRAPRRDFHWLAAAGGALGLTTLVRHNPWLLIPAALVIILVLEWKQWRRWLLGSLVFMLAFGAAISPWMIRNQLNNGKPFYFLVAFEGVVMLQRYNVYLTPPATPTPSVQAGDQDNPEVVPKIEIPSQSETVEQQPEKRPSILTRIISRGFKFVPQHFFHNLLVTAAIFPSSPVMDNLEITIKKPGSIWDEAWNGRPDIGGTVMTLILLGILSMGIGASWKRWKWTGLLPGLIFLAYGLATAAARTSGGRYIQPADWIALFYLAVGLMQTWQWFCSFFKGRAAIAPAQYIESVGEGLKDWRSKPAFPWKILLACAAAFSISGSMALTEWVFPLRYPPMTTSELIEELDEEGWIARMGLQPDDLHHFLEDEDAMLWRGRALYPRYYGIGSGEPDRFSAYRERDFPRLVISTIGQDEFLTGVLPLSSPPDYFPNGADVIVLGCREELNYELAAIIMTWPGEILYTRSPASPLTCPLPEPVCNDNRVCR